MLLPSVRKFVLLAIATMCGVFNFSYRPVPAIVQDRTVQRFAGSEEQGGSQDLRKVLSSFYTRRSDYEWGEFRGYVFLFCFLIHVLYASAKMPLRRCVRSEFEMAELYLGLWECKQCVRGRGSVGYVACGQEESDRWGEWQRPSKHQPTSNALQLWCFTLLASFLSLIVPC